MSTPAQISEVEATTQMSHTSDTQPSTTGADEDSNAPTVAGADTDSNTPTGAVADSDTPTVAVADDEGNALTVEEQIASKQRVGKQLIDNPVQTFFGTVIVALLVFTLTSTNARIDDVHASINARIDDINTSINARIDDVNDRITRLEEKIDARFMAIDARFTALEKDVAEINLKLTALITAFNVTPEITAAQEGRIISDTQDADDEPD